MRRNGLRCDGGQATVELALCLPLVALLIGALVEVGLLIGDQVRLWHAAREAARVAVVDPDDKAALEAARATGFGDLDISVRPERNFRRQGSPLTVQLVYDRPGAVPLVGALFSGVVLRSEATMRIERP
jgi:hypothetical protein